MFAWLGQVRCAHALLAWLGQVHARVLFEAARWMRSGLTSTALYSYALDQRGYILICPAARTTARTRHTFKIYLPAFESVGHGGMHQMPVKLHSVSFFNLHVPTA